MTFDWASNLKYRTFIVIANKEALPAQKKLPNIKTLNLGRLYNNKLDQIWQE